jgi:hypothetical protein
MLLCITIDTSGLRWWIMVVVEVMMMDVKMAVVW